MSRPTVADHPLSLRLRSASCSLLPALALWLCFPSAAVADQVTVPLAQYESTEKTLRELRELTAQLGMDAEVLVGETLYKGASDGRNLRMTLTMRAQLSASEAFKRVPLLGRDVFVVGARTSRGPVALSQEDGFWIWQTKERGRVEVEVEFIVPPSGPRGSIEYTFGVVRSPITEFRATFPQRNLSPQVRDAAVTERTETPSGTELRAVLPTVSQIQVVGFHDVAALGEDRPAKLYGQSHNLVSISDDTVEIFTVVNYTILYASAKQFEIELPPGFELLSADGRGAFRYMTKSVDHRPVLVGETAYGIQQNYEISLRLRRALAASESSVTIRIPKLREVERDGGFVAIEVPGKISVDQAGGSGLAPIDVRELPQAIAESSVSPIVRAFRYSTGGSEAEIKIGRYPEKLLAAGGVDHLSASVLLTKDGSIMTDLHFKLRNSLRQHLALELPEASEVKSAVLEGQPIKPSRDEKGRVLIPLIRSRDEGRGLEPFEVRLVYESAATSLGWFGWKTLSLPRLDVPVASLGWTVYGPDGYRWSAFRTDVDHQTVVKDASWYRAPIQSADVDLAEGFENAQEVPEIRETDSSLRPAQRDAFRAPRSPAPTQAVAPLGPSGGERLEGTEAPGAMPIRLQVPRAGTRRFHQRFWMEPAENLEGTIYYVRRGLVLPGHGLAWLAGVVLLVVMVSYAQAFRMRFVVFVGATAWLLFSGTVFSSVLAFFAAGLFVLWRRRFHENVLRYVRALVARHRVAWIEQLVKEKDELALGFATRRQRSLAYAVLGVTASLSWRAMKLVAFGILLLTVLAGLLRLLAILGRPL